MQGSHGDSKRDQRREKAHGDFRLAGCGEKITDDKHVVAGDPWHTGCREWGHGRRIRLGGGDSQWNRIGSDEAAGNEQWQERAQMKMHGVESTCLIPPQ